MYEAPVMSTMQQVHNKCVCLRILFRAGHCAIHGESRNTYILSFPYTLSQAGIQDADEVCFRDGSRRPTKYATHCWVQMLQPLKVPVVSGGTNVQCPFTQENGAHQECQGACAKSRRQLGKGWGSWPLFQGSAHHFDWLSKTSQL